MKREEYLLPKSKDILDDQSAVKEAGEQCLYRNNLLTFSHFLIDRSGHIFFRSLPNASETENLITNYFCKPIETLLRHQETQTFAFKTCLPLSILLQSSTDYIQQGRETMFSKDPCETLKHIAFICNTLNREFAQFSQLLSDHVIYFAFNAQYEKIFKILYFLCRFYHICHEDADFNNSNFISYLNNIFNMMEIHTKTYIKPIIEAKTNMTFDFDSKPIEDRDRVAKDIKKIEEEMITIYKKFFKVNFSRHIDPNFALDFALVGKRYNISNRVNIIEFLLNTYEINQHYAYNNAEKILQALNIEVLENEKLVEMQSSIANITDASKGEIKWNEVTLSAPSSYLKSNKSDHFYNLIIDEEFKKLFTNLQKIISTSDSTKEDIRTELMKNIDVFLNEPIISRFTNHLLSHALSIDPLKNNECILNMLLKNQHIIDLFNTCINKIMDTDFYKNMKSTLLDNNNIKNIQKFIYLKIWFLILKKYPIPNELEHKLNETELNVLTELNLALKECSNLIKNHQFISDESNNIEIEISNQQITYKIKRTREIELQNTGTTIPPIEIENEKSKIELQNTGTTIPPKVTLTKLNKNIKSLIKRLLFYLGPVAGISLFVLAYYYYNPFKINY